MLEKSVWNSEVKNQIAQNAEEIRHDLATGKETPEKLRLCFEVSLDTIEIIEEPIMKSLWMIVMEAERIVLNEIETGTL